MSVAESTQTILYEVMATNLALQLNFQERGGKKRGTKDIRITNVIYGKMHLLRYNYLSGVLVYHLFDVRCVQ